jgi:TatA/E family protein of Tat protein translocase
MNTLLLFNFENPILWIGIVAVIFLLFGGSKLPQLAKALGQSKRAFKDGLSEAEAEEDEKKRKDLAGAKPASLSAVDDEALFDEARRRARLRVAEGSIPEDRK